MVQPVSPELMQLLNHDSGPMSIVMGFALLTEPDLVHSAFKKHNRNAMLQVGQEIRMIDPASVTYLREVEGRLPQDVRSVEELAHEITTKLEALPLGDRDFTAQDTDTIYSLWERSLELWRSLSPEQRARVRPLWQSTLHTLNENFSFHRQKFEQHEAAIERAARLREKTPAKPPELQRKFLVLEATRLKETYVRTSLMRRFEQAIQSQGLDSANREQGLRCLNALQASQKAAASFCLVGRDRFNVAVRSHFAEGRVYPPEWRVANRGSETHFSLARFSHLEREVLDVEAEQRIINITAFWNDISFQMHAAGLVNPLLTYSQKKAWLRDPANAPTLAQIQRLYLHDVTVLPEEIESLSHVSRITLICDGWASLETLPESLARLPQLSHLELVRQRLREIPEVLARMPRLETLIIRDNGNPLRVFPESVARQQYGGFWGVYTDYLDRADGPPANVPAGGVRHFAWMPRHQFTDIPFFLWFREWFSLPYVPNLDFRSSVWLWGGETLIERWLSHIMHAAHSFFDCLGLPRSWQAELMVVPLYGFLGLVYAVQGIIHCVNAPIFLYNLFANLAIEPVVSFVRENLLGYSPMIHIRDIQA